MPTLPAPLLTDFARQLFEAVGVPSRDASIVASSLVGANLRGHDSHGVMRVPQYVDLLERGQYRIDAELKLLHETPAVVVCDGQWGLGQVQAHRLLDLILPRARQLGLAAGAARHCGHIGMHLHRRPVDCPSAAPHGGQHARRASARLGLCAR